MADFFVLLNSGDYVLLNDGTSRVLLNSSTPAVDNGVIISGQHATPLIGSIAPPKRQTNIKEYELIALGKITRTVSILAKCTIIKIMMSEVRGRISRLFHENTALSKITRLIENINAKSFTYVNENDYQHAKKIQESRRIAKVKRLRSMFEEYKEFEDE